MFPAMLQGLGLRPALKLADQSRSVGRSLLSRNRSAGNVEFYKRFGFEVTGTASIHNVVNYFMSRK